MGSIIKAVSSIVSKAGLGFNPYSFFISLAINFAISFVAKKLFAPKKSDLTNQSFTQEAKDRQIVIRSATQQRRVVYGKAMISGALVYANTSSSKKFLHMIVAMTHGRNTEIERVFFNDLLTTDNKFSKTKKQVTKMTALSAALSGSVYKVQLRIDGTTFTGSQSLSSKTFSIYQVSAPTTDAITDRAVSSLISAIKNHADYATRNYTVVKLKAYKSLNPFQSNAAGYQGVVQVTAKVAGTGFSVSDGGLGTWNTQVVTANLNDQYATIVKHNGDIEQAADRALKSDITEWTSAHQLKGIGYFKAKLKGDPDIYPTGVPNMKALLRGREIYDPRITGKTITSSSGGRRAVFNIAGHGFLVSAHIFIRNHITAVPTVFGAYYVTKVVDADNVKLRALTDPNNILALTTGGTGGTATEMLWTDNWALCLADYVLAPFGLRADEQEVNFDDVITAANISDEQVTLTSTTEDFTAATSDLCTQASNGVDIRTGDIVKLTTTDTLPAGLARATNYYYINRAGNELREFYLATTLANARAGIAVDVTDTGSGTHTIKHKSQLRYTMNGGIDLNVAPASIIEAMVSAGAGEFVYSQGAYRIYAGAFTSSVMSLDEDNLRAAINTVPTSPMRELFNAVRGTFTDPAKFYQPTSFPPVKNSTYAAQDSGEVYENIELAFTDQSVAAQRLGKIMLEKSRQGIVVKMPCNFSALKVTVGDVVDLTISTLGWSSKNFRIIGWEFAEEGGVDLSMREESAASYSWLAGDETSIDTAPDTTLENPLTPPPDISNLTLTSGTAELLETGDGNVLSRIHVAWDAVTDEFVLNGGHLEIGYKLSGDDDWSSANLNPDTVGYFVTAIGDNLFYDVRIKAVNVIGISSAEYVFSLNHEVIGKTQVPSDVASLAASQNGSVVVFLWSKAFDSDLAGFEIRYGLRANYTWETATTVTEVTKGTQVTTAAIPPGDWTFAIKTKDTTGNEAAVAATSNLVVTSDFDIIQTVIENPLFAGTLTNLVRHWSGVLAPESQDADALADDIWDEAVIRVEPTCIYEAASEVDISFDDTVRVYSNIVSSLMPGESGVATPTFQIDSKLAAGSYDGFEDFVIGFITGRYFKFKQVIDTTIGVAFISAISNVVDVQERTESGIAEVIGASGTTITFNTQFHTQAAIKVTANSGTALIPTFDNEGLAGFDAHVFNTSGTEVGGTVDWEAKGA